MSLVQHFTSTPRTWPAYGHVLILPVPAAVVAFFKAANVKRFICTINGEYEMPCALHALKGGGRYLMLSKRVRSEYELEPTVSVQVQLEEDTSEFGHPVPEEWQAILDFDEEAAAIFRALSPGKQRTILYQVGAAKREETRITRALRVAENLKLGIRNPQQFLKKY